MAAETLGETPNSPETLAECLRILRKIERELDTWRPVIEKFRTPAAAMLAARRAARNGR